MKYVIRYFDGKPSDGLNHLLKGDYDPNWPEVWPEPPPQQMVRTWCGAAFQNTEGLTTTHVTQRYAHCIVVDAPRVHLTPCQQCLEAMEIENEYPKKLAAMDNDHLYQEFRNAHEPDDYDGEYTVAGEMRLTLAVAEFERRLLEIGFLAALNAD